MLTDRPRISSLVRLAVRTGQPVPDAVTSSSPFSKAAMISRSQSGRGPTLSFIPLCLKLLKIQLSSDKYTVKALSSLLQASLRLWASMAPLFQAYTNSEWA